MSQLAVIIFGSAVGFSVGLPAVGGGSLPTPFSNPAKWLHPPLAGDTLLSLAFITPIAGLIPNLRYHSLDSRSVPPGGDRRRSFARAAGPSRPSDRDCGLYPFSSAKAICTNTVGASIHADAAASRALPQSRFDWHLGVLRLLEALSGVAGCRLTALISERRRKLTVTPAVGTLAWRMA